MANTTRHKTIKQQAKLLLFTCLFMMMNTVGVAQTTGLDQKISIDLRQLSLENALDSIAKKTNTYFTYNANILNNKPVVNVLAKETALYSILRQILPDTTLDFKLINKQILIVPAKVKTRLTDQILKPQLKIKKLKGHIRSKNNKKALAYASIGIRGKAVGTISNIEGEFLFNIESQYFNDTLTFSFIGFENKEIPINTIQDSEINIELVENFVSLQEVIIRNTDPLALLKASIHNFNQNYPKQASLLTAFYRESVSKNKNYMIYLESILDIYKTPYNSNRNPDQVKVFQSRKIYDTNRLDTVSLRLKGGVKGCLQLDIVKNRADFLDPEKLDHYSFHLVDISSYDNHPVYIIHFQPKIKQKHPLMQGDLYIDTRSLALIRARFSYPLTRVRETKHHFVAHKSSKTRVRPLKIEYLVSYKKINGKYFLSHSKGNLKFKVRNRRKFFAKTFETSFEMAVTKIDTNNIERFRYKERLRPNAIMSRSRLPYDAKFWGLQNYIEPEESIHKALKRINAHIQVAQKNN